MCGINGIFAYRSSAPQVDASEVARVRDSMAARGPDSAGLWISDNGRVGLGHRRLSIIDLSPDGNQPMFSADGKLVLVTNGEIYNYRELKVELEAKGHRFRTQSDTEVILALYEEFGLSMFSRLRGMFALALYDSQQRELVLARGPMGIKPLFIADDGSTIRFASQVKALLAGQGIDTSPDPAGHVGFFVWGHVPSPHTLYKGIKELRAGSYVVVSDNGDVRSKDFSQVKDWLARSPGTCSGVDLHDALADTVKHHFISDVPVSVFLSAGRDSTTLLALAAESKLERIRTITLAFQEYLGTSDDESLLAEQVAEMYGAEHRTQVVAGTQFRDDVDGLFEAMDQPTIDGANTYFVCKVASQMGIRVALSGLGADEVFGGYPSFSQVPNLSRKLKWAGAMPGIWAGSGRFISRFLPKRFSPKYAGLLEYGGTLEGAYLLRRSLFMPWEIFREFDPEFALKGLEELDIRGRLNTFTKGFESNHAKIAALELSSYMQNRLLRDSDWASMANSLELRVPFVDIELMKRIGPWIASDMPPTKTDMANSPQRALPQEVLSRPKTGFNIPVADWVLSMEANSRREPSIRRWARYVYRRHTGDQHLRRRSVA